MNPFAQDPFSPAQLAGYVALTLGVITYSQKNDFRLKLWSVAQSLAYGLHYYLLGNLGAMSSFLVSSARSGTAAYVRRPWFAALFVGFYFGFGSLVASGLAGWLPIFANSISTCAMFMLSGAAMRLTILCATMMILTTNILSGSIGGTILECFIAGANIITVVRLLRAERRAAS